MQTSDYPTSVIDRAREWCGEAFGDYTDEQLAEACADIESIDRDADAAERAVA